jgi:[ribosomal protein S5]-alanine N-acetyltransferase
MPAIADQSPQSQIVATQRLVLRTVAAADAADVAQLAGDWQVARMLADMPHPLEEAQAVAWVQSAVGDRCLAITLDGQMIGSVSVCVTSDPSFSNGDMLRGEFGASAELGFWIGRPWWGHGYAREAAGAVIRSLMGLGEVALFTSGHFADNVASRRVLEVLGFQQTGMTEQWCLARRETLPALRYELAGPTTIDAGQRERALRTRD